MKNFWPGKRVLVTGHTGFKGAWLSLWLQSLGAQVWALALPPSTSPNLFEIFKLDSKIHSHFGDIRDPQTVSKVIDDSKAEIVFHLAAQALVDRGYSDPIETFSTNIMGTVHLLEALRTNSNLRSCVIVTSDKCYASQTSAHPFKETDALGGHDPYSASKSATEIITHSYRQSFFEGKKIATARSGNTIGGGDFSESRLIPHIIACLKENKTPQIRNPQSVRPWMSHLDVLGGYLNLAQKLFESQDFARPWNFGPETTQKHTVSEIIKETMLLWGPNLKDYKHIQGPHTETPSLLIDSQSAQEKLNWTSRLDFNGALRLAVEWYRAHLGGQDMVSLSLKQIDSFLDLKTSESSRN